jgi:hypothetical protein
MFERSFTRVMTSLAAPLISKQLEGLPILVGWLPLGRMVWFCCLLPALYMDSTRVQRHKTGHFCARDVWMGAGLKFPLSSAGKQYGIRIAAASTYDWDEQAIRSAGDWSVDREYCIPCMAE